MGIRYALRTVVWMVVVVVRSTGILRLWRMPRVMAMAWSVLALIIMPMPTLLKVSTMASRKKETKSIRHEPRNKPSPPTKIPRHHNTHPKPRQQSHPTKTRSTTPISLSTTMPLAIATAIATATPIHPPPSFLTQRLNHSGSSWRWTIPNHHGKHPPNGRTRTHRTMRHRRTNRRTNSIHPTTTPTNNRRRTLKHTPNHHLPPPLPQPHPHPSPPDGGSNSTASTPTEAGTTAARGVSPASSPPPLPPLGPVGVARRSRWR